MLPGSAISEKLLTQSLFIDARIHACTHAQKDQAVLVLHIQEDAQNTNLPRIHTYHNIYMPIDTY